MFHIYIYTCQAKVSINIYVNTNICLHIARPVSMFCSAACFPIFLGNLGTSHLRSWLPSARDLDPVLCCAACSGCCQAQLQLLVGSVLLLLVNDLILLVEGEGGGQVLLHVRVELLYVQLGLEEEPDDVPPDNYGVGCLDAGHGCCSVYVCSVRCVDCDSH